MFVVVYKTWKLKMSCNTVNCSLSCQSPILVSLQIDLLILGVESILVFQLSQHPHQQGYQRVGEALQVSLCVEEDDESHHET